MNFFKKLKLFDILILIIILIAIIVGFLTFKGIRKTSSNQIQAETEVAIEIYFRGVTISSQNSPFSVGDETFITIRNVPYTKLKITDVKFDRKKTIVPTFNSKNPYISVNDVSLPNQYDFLVTVVDSAKITKDKGGAVVGGNKVKIGLPVTLEGVDYRLNGVISNVTPIQPSETKELTREINNNKDVH